MNKGLKYILSVLSIVTGIIFILFVMCIIPNHRYNGIDISHYNHDIDWSSVKKDRNIKFCIVKASEGQNWTDPQYKINIRKANKIGLKTVLPLNE